MKTIGNDLHNYIRDVCKLNVSSTNDDTKIGKLIMDMTHNKYGIIKENYKTVGGLTMLAEGKMKMKLNVLQKFQYCLKWINFAHMKCYLHKELS